MTSKKSFKNVSCFLSLNMGENMIVRSFHIALRFSERETKDFVSFREELCRAIRDYGFNSLYFATIETSYGVRLSFYKSAYDDGKVFKLFSTCFESIFNIFEKFFTKKYNERIKDAILKTLNDHLSLHIITPEQITQIDRSTFLEGFRDMILKFCNDEQKLLTRINSL